MTATPLFPARRQTGHDCRRRDLIRPCARVMESLALNEAVRHRSRRASACRLYLSRSTSDASTHLNNIVNKNGLEQAPISVRDPFRRKSRNYRHGRWAWPEAFTGHHPFEIASGVQAVAAISARVGEPPTCWPVSGVAVYHVTARPYTASLQVLQAFHQSRTRHSPF